MKINNLEKFYNEDVDPSLIALVRKKSKFVTSGDIIKLYSETETDDVPGSTEESKWHLDLRETDKWWKMSFDGGITFPILMRLENIVIPGIEKAFEKAEDQETAEENGTWYVDEDENVVFDQAIIIDENYEVLKNGTVKVQYEDENGFRHDLQGFGYKFNDEEGTISINYNEKQETEFSVIYVSVKVGITNQSLPAIPYHVYNSSIAAIPTVYDDTYKTCNYLDSNIPSIESITKLYDVDLIYLSILTPSLNVSGDIVLKIEVDDTVIFDELPFKNITNTRQVFPIYFETPIEGTLKITRLIGNEKDTLNDISNGIEALTAIITDIKAESSSK